MHNKNQFARKSKQGVIGPDGKNIFALPRQLSNSVRKCSRNACCENYQLPSDLQYVWVFLTHTFDDTPPASGAARLSLEDWLSVVDEAAGLGADLLVFSVGDSFDACPHVWDICRWAQGNYQIKIGLHTTAPAISAPALAALQSLDPALTCLLVSPEHLHEFRPIERAGVRIGTATPDDHGHHSECSLPEDMLFVDANGTMYTCGYVKGNRDFKLGHVFEKQVQKTVQDPSLPHSVPCHVPKDDHGCDGCPPLMVRYFIEERA